MAHLLNTDDTNLHAYAYTIEDVAKMIALVLQHAHRHPEDIARHKYEHLSDRALGVARMFDDATDGNDAWDVGDVEQGLRRTVG